MKRFAQKIVLPLIILITYSFMTSPLDEAPEVYSDSQRSEQEILANHEPYRREIRLDFAQVRRKRISRRGDKLTYVNRW